MVYRRCHHQTFCPSWRHYPPASPRYLGREGATFCPSVQQNPVVANLYECHAPLLAFSKDCRAFSWTQMKHGQCFFPSPSPFLSLSQRFVVAFVPDYPFRVMQIRRIAASSIRTWGSRWWSERALEMDPSKVSVDS